MGCRGGGVRFCSYFGRCWWVGGLDVFRFLFSHLCFSFFVFSFGYSAASAFVSSSLRIRARACILTDVSSPIASWDDEVYYPSQSSLSLSSPAPCFSPSSSVRHSQPYPAYSTPPAQLKISGSSPTQLYQHVYTHTAYPPLSPSRPTVLTSPTAVSMSPLEPHRRVIVRARAESAFVPRFGALPSRMRSCPVALVWWLSALPGLTVIRVIPSFFLVESWDDKIHYPS